MAIGRTSRSQSGGMMFDVARAVVAAPTRALPPRERPVGAGALWFATHAVTLKAGQTVVLLALAAALVPADLGVVALATLVSSAVALVSGLGASAALVRWEGDVDRAARSAVSLALASGAAATLAVWVSAPALVSALGAGPAAVGPVRGLVLTAPLVAAAMVTLELMRRRLAFGRRVLPDVAASLLGAALAVWLVGRGWGVAALVAGQVVQGVAVLLLAWCVHPPVRPGWHADDVRGLLRFGLPWSGAHLLELVQVNLDYVVVAHLLGAVALGHYSLAFRVAAVPYLLVAVVLSSAAFPVLCRRRGAELRATVSDLARLSLVLLLPVCGLLALLADRLVLLGPAWAPAVPVLRVLAAYALAAGLLHVTLTVLHAMGRPGEAVLARLAHLLLLLPALLLLAPAGVVAVAAAQVVVAAAVLLAALARVGSLLGEARTR
ncbi:oligosaccharide flippase family protein [Nocardioides sp. P86]|uniref:oligosaccharide flippase family protein n=1 Tax=Nocardioides sp. P86 TaxID=2939569 RepID=UPI00203EFB86|nr:oligosaccharide flippase family protein [Nocardioides sp. P86]